MTCHVSPHPLIPRLHAALPLMQAVSPVLSQRQDARAFAYRQRLGWGLALVCACSRHELEMRPRAEQILDDAQDLETLFNLQAHHYLLSQFGHLQETTDVMKNQRGALQAPGQPTPRVLLGRSAETVTHLSALAQCRDPGQWDSDEDTPFPAMWALGAFLSRVDKALADRLINALMQHDGDVLRVPARELEVAYSLEYLPMGDERE